MESIEVEVILDTDLEISIGKNSYFITGSANDRSIIEPIKINKTYEPETLKLINKILPHGGTFVDVGANIGVLSVFAALKVGNTGKVLSIEASPTNFKYLKDNAKLNNCPNIISVNMGVWDEIATLDLKYIPDLAGCSFFSIPEIDLEEMQKVHRLNSSIAVQKVNCDTLDSIIADNEIDKIDLMKIDVEGAELKALLGGEKTIKKFRPKILMELNPHTLKKFFEIELHDVYDQLKSFGYSIKLICDNGDLMVINNIEQLQEIFSNSKGWEDVLCEMI